MSRRGIALPAALMALLLSSTLAALLLSAATRRLEAGARQLAARKALAAADGSVARHGAGWDSVLAAGVAPGVAVEVASVPGAGAVETRDSLLNLGAGLYLLQSSGTVRTGGRELARQVVADVWGPSPGGSQFVPGGWWRWDR